MLGSPHRVLYTQEASLEREEVRLRKLLSRHALLPILAVAIFSLLVTVVYALLTNDSRAASLSAVAACLSGLGALLVSLRTQWSDQDRRQREQIEAETKRTDTRKAIAALYSAEISAWRSRADVDQFLMEIRGVWGRDRIEAHPIEVVLLARDSIIKVSGIDAVPPDLVETVTESAQNLCRQLAIPTFERFPEIPNIWASQFKKDEIEILGADAPIRFATLGVVWTNLNLKARQIPNSASVVRFIEAHPKTYSMEYVYRLSTYVSNLAGLFSKFDQAVAACADCLSRCEGTNPMKDLTIPPDMVVGSQKAALRIQELENDIEFERMYKKMKAAGEGLKEVEAEAAKASADLDLLKAASAAVRESA